MLVKLLVVILLLAIVISLFSGLFFLVKDRGKTNRTVKTLSLRIGLSVLTFVLLMVATATGLISPHGVG